MYKCKFCGRYLKEPYNNCPGCGSTAFEKINDYGPIKITKVPNGGYKINTKNLKKDNLAGVILTVMGIFVLVAEAYTLFSFLIAGTVFQLYQLV